MAKATAPLLSIGATGKFANTLVGFVWKGIKVIREYKVPANPQTTDQVTVRTRFSAMVYAWRNYFVDTDLRAAWDRWALLSGKPQSGFNGFMSQASKVAETDPDASFALSSEALNSQALRWTMGNLDDGTAGDEAGNFEVWLGTSPRSLLKVAEYAIAAGKVDTADLGDADDIVYAKIRKGGYDRSGIQKYTLLA